MKKIFFIAMLASFAAQAKLTVVTTTTDLSAITKEIGKDLINVDSIAKGTQDPHYIEAKPSFMTKVSQADLVESIGLSLEVGWLPKIIQGARNPKVTQGSQGYLEVGGFVNPIEVPSGSISRAEGDIHPFGNPHILLDPIRAGEVALQIAKRLGELDPSHKDNYMQNAVALQTRLKDKVAGWKDRIDKSGVKKIVTYHKTLNYFFDRFNIVNSAILEPKPGIPPTPGHIVDVIQMIKDQNIPLILVENYFDSNVTNKIRQDISSVRAKTVAVAVGGSSGLSSIDDVYENLVKNIESGT